MLKYYTIELTIRHVIMSLDKDSHLFLRLLKLIPRLGELLRHHVTRLHQIL